MVLGIKLGPMACEAYTFTPVLSLDKELKILFFLRPQLEVLLGPYAMVWVS